MYNTNFKKFDKLRLDDKNLPNTNNIPASPSEQLVRKDIRKLNQNIEEIKKLREEVKKKKQKEEKTKS